jgi:hypothetical protein
MSDPRTERFGLRVQAVAANLAYPPTPNISMQVKARLESKVYQLWRTSGDVRLQRRFMFAALALALACITSLAVPQVRATLIDFFQIGAVRIFFTEPTPTPTQGTGAVSPAGPGQAASLSTPTLLPSLLDLSGQTTLAEARAQTGYALPLPTYPSDLGQPDYVFLQNLNGDMVILVWLDPAQPARIRLSLHFIAPGSFAIKKVEPKFIQFTTVNGREAVWAEGPYLLQLSSADYGIRRLIEGQVLIWTDADLTYRLETDQALEEAIKIAESLK